MCGALEQWVEAGIESDRIIAKFPAQVHDVKAAVRWIRAHAQRYHLDPDRIAAWGASAGGYLASMLGTSAGVSELEDLSLGNPDQPSHVQAVVTWFGPTDFLKMDEQLAERGLPPGPGIEHNLAVRVEVGKGAVAI